MALISASQRDEAQTMYRAYNKQSKLEINVSITGRIS